MSRGQTIAQYSSFFDHLSDALLICHGLGAACGGVIQTNLYGRSSYMVRGSGAPLQVFVSGVSLFNFVC